MARRRRSPEQVIRKIAEGQKLLEGAENSSGVLWGRGYRGGSEGVGIEGAS